MAEKGHGANLVSRAEMTSWTEMVSQAEITSRAKITSRAEMTSSKPGRDSSVCIRARGNLGVINRFSYLVIVRDGHGDKQ